MRRWPLLLLPALAACSSSPTRYWTIEPLAGLPAPAAPRGTAPVQIAAVHVPLAIDRLEVVRHDEADRIVVLDFDRWSAPPGSLLRTALTQDLVARMPAGSVVFPDAPAPAGLRRITVDVLDLRRIGDRFVMQASWSLAGPAARPHALRLDAPAGEGDVAAQTAALATMTGALADSIAAALARGQGGVTPG
ncbi:ABC-type transport auxiliary lipoprotein family protein [Sphingomonas sp. CROZ-RG-20F-R02-07]|uniref:PqiC family protein n=1 Tax=Sphingomonas sp. CROZ-RG-20F-R02-07 TaxID=2914832 RepID=UPI001F565EFF